MAHAAIGLIPMAHYTAMNRLVAMIAGEDVINSVNLSRLCNATGTYPEDADPFDHATHALGAWAQVTPEWLDIFQGLSTNLPAPAGGWPLMVSGNVVLTEQQAQDAAEAFILSVTTQSEWSPAMIQITRASVLAANGLNLLD